MTDEISYEQHIQQNNQRLVSIRNNITDPGGYAYGCQELTGWCSDSRAFHAAFEENLISTLEAIVVQSSRNGFDREMAKQLIAACFVHRKLLSKANTTKVSRWHDQLRKPKRGTGTTSKRKAAKTPAATTSAPAAAPVPAPANPTIESPEQNYVPAEKCFPTDNFVDGRCPVFVDSQSTMWAQQGNAAMLPEQSVMFAGEPTLQAHHQPMAYASPNHPYGAGSLPQSLPQPPPLDVPSPYPVDPSGARPMRPMDEQQRQMLMRQQYVRMRNPPMSYLPQGQPMNPQGVMPQAVPQAVPMHGYPVQNGSASMIRAGPPMLYSQMQQQGQQKVTAFPNPHAAPDAAPMLPRAPNAAPIISLREIVLQPFALEQPQSTVNFVLNQSCFQALQYPDMELQLKAFVREDAQQACSWPAVRVDPQEISFPITVVVNGYAQSIKSPSFPLYIKGFCSMGNNSIQISSSSAAGHFFILQVVQLHNFANVFATMVKTWQNAPTAQMDVEKCRERVLHLIYANNLASEGLRVSLNCPQTKSRLCIPVRSVKCGHVDCFELEPFLFKNREETLHRCPICGAVFTHQEIKVDGFVSLILQGMSTQPEVKMVVVNANGSWRPVDTQEQPMPTGSNGLKRHMSEQLCGNGAAAMKRLRAENGTRPDPVIGQPQSVPPGSALLSPCGVATSSGGSPTTVFTAKGPGFPEMPITPASSLTSSSPNNGVSSASSASSSTKQLEPTQATGSAPYTPASVGSAHSGVTNGLQNNTFSDLPSLGGEGEECDLFSDFSFPLSNADMQRYLFDEPAYPSCQASFDLNNSDDWRDAMSIVSENR
uniref:SP-RING-type domain-containing protein n=1 Tax=Steinernema glaseri TaxID=37863 RepID=A0A1I7YKV5_9BILA